MTILVAMTIGLASLFFLYALAQFWREATGRARRHKGRPADVVPLHIVYADRECYNPGSWNNLGCSEPKTDRPMSPCSPVSKMQRITKQLQEQSAADWEAKRSKVRGAA